MLGSHWICQDKQGERVCCPKSRLVSDRGLVQINSDSLCKYVFVETVNVEVITSRLPSWTLSLAGTCTWPQSLVSRPQLPLQVWGLLEQSSRAKRAHHSHWSTFLSLCQYFAALPMASVGSIWVRQDKEGELVCCLDAVRVGQRACPCKYVFAATVSANFYVFHHGLSQVLELVLALSLKFLDRSGLV